MQRFFVHNVLMAGSPGSGKTLLVRAIPGILPELSDDRMWIAHACKSHRLIHPSGHCLTSDHLRAALRCESKSNLPNGPEIRF